MAGQNILIRATSREENEQIQSSSFLFQERKFINKSSNKVDQCFILFTTPSLGLIGVAAILTLRYRKTKRSNLKTPALRFSVHRQHFDIACLTFPQR